MSGPAKRRREVIDLTDGTEAENGRQAKVPRYPSSSSSQPSSSQFTNYDGEPDAIDLTQSDDGPVREIYGSLGTRP